MSEPFESPPRIPPALLVVVMTLPPCTRKGSLFSLPRITAALCPAPISRPLTAPIENIALARSASSLSNTGWPIPAGIPVTLQVTVDPIESCSFRTLDTSSSHFSKSETGISPTAASFAVTLIPSMDSSFIATAPPATRAAVSRAEDLPPPR